MNPKSKIRSISMAYQTLPIVIITVLITKFMSKSRNELYNIFTMKESKNYSGYFNPIDFFWSKLKIVSQMVSKLN